MGRYTGASCKQCRREGTKLFLKGTKCFTEKCPVERRPYAPGQHGQNTARRRKSSEYAKQLREKQKIKRIYGLSEQQFRNTFERVSTLPGITGHNLLAALESRLDNMIYRMGFAPSRKAARQLIRHRHVEVNGKNVDIPSFAVAPGQEIRIRQKSREVQPILAAMEQSARGVALSWLAVDRDTFSGRMLERPSRPNIPIAAQEQLVVELYSK
ncbi:MAG TPA: 30S ribosomal protein S4 [Gemmatimonadaceae bacterium]|jgi:small subunit ribosomal protein S4|nr:30S ribosomal protein S4 [Gemmatimonadaceae bacterium]